jgi:hypothetical protein
MRYSGHETFACRYAWLPKAYRSLAVDPATFVDEEQAMVRLGVGKNMVRSIRFWVEVMGVAKPQVGRILEPTAFGQAVFADGGFDPFLEDIRTLWLLHWNVSTRFADPLFAWDFLLNKWPYAELTRSEALAAFLRESRRLNVAHSEVTLAQHLDVFLHTYVSTRGTKGALEDSLDSPLVDLNLLQIAGERRFDGSIRRDPVYAFRREAKPNITLQLFEYCLDDFWKRKHEDDATVTYRDVAISPGSLGQVFKLPEDDVRTRLDIYTLPNSHRPFNYQPSAVQGLISRRNTGERDFLASVYLGDINGA